MPIELKREKVHLMKKYIRNFRKLSSRERYEIQCKLDEIFAGKAKPDIKKLSEFDIADYRLRIGNYRILFNWDKKSGHMMFIDCRHRKDLY